VLVNPRDTQKVADRLDIALRMPIKEQKKRMRAMQDRLSSYDIFKWAEEFMGALQKTQLPPVSTAPELKAEHQEHMMENYKSAKNRLFLLDYDGTLREFVDSPDAKAARPSKELKATLKKLQSDPKNTVIIVSGRPKGALHSFFKNGGLGLVAEHGAWVFKAGKWIKSSLSSKKWQNEFIPKLREFVDRTPGAELEVKDFSLVWHYRRVTPDLAFVRKEELKMELQSIAKQHEDIQVFEGQKMLEIKTKSMHKGSIATELLASEKWDFIMAAGDDYTDEDMFRVLPESAYTVRVGESPRETVAHYSVKSVEKFRKLLSNL
jgi:trehalose 6-phosphate synthase/phosphatase